MSDSKSTPSILLDKSTVDEVTQICVKQLHSIPLYDVSAQQQAVAELVHQVQQEIARRVLAHEESDDAQYIYDKLKTELL